MIILLHTQFFIDKFIFSCFKMHYFHKFVHYKIRIILYINLVKACQLLKSIKPKSKSKKILMRTRK